MFLNDKISSCKATLKTTHNLVIDSNGRYFKVRVSRGLLMISRKYYILNWPFLNSNFKL